MDPLNPPQVGQNAQVDHTPIGGVANIASRFTGQSVAQPEHSFHSSYAESQQRSRQATDQAISLQHAYRGKGDDWMSEFERMRRLELQAQRRAEREARENLHRYRGMHMLILALQRAKLGLPLTEAQQALLGKHGPELNLQIYYSPEQIEAERIKALEELMQEEQGRLHEQARSRTSGSQDLVHILAAAEADGSRTPQLQMPDSTVSMDDVFANSRASGVTSGFHPLDASNLQTTPARPLPSLPSTATEDASKTDSIGEAAFMTTEAEDLMTLLTSILRAAGRALTLGQLSEAIADKTGYSWGAHFESTHGPLLNFVRLHAIPGYHIITQNKYVSLAGMALPAGSPRGADASAMSGEPQALVPYGASSNTPSTNSYMLTQYSYPQNPYSNTPPQPFYGGYPAAYPPHPYGASAYHSYQPSNASTSSMFSAVSGPPSTHHSYYPYSGGMPSQFPGYMQPGPHQMTQFTPPPQPVPPALSNTVVATNSSNTSSTPSPNPFDLDEFFDPTVFAPAPAPAAGKQLKDKDSDKPKDITRTRRLSTTTMQVAEPSPASSAARVSGSGVASTRGNVDLDYSGVFSTNLEPAHAGRKTSRKSMVTVTESHADFATAASTARRPAGAAALPPNDMSTTRRHSLGTMPPARQELSMQPSTRGFDVEQFARRAVERGACEDDRLTWQDFDILFRPILVHSFILIKHGRSGLPKRHRFWMTNALNRIYWDTTKFMDLMKTGERHIEMGDVVCLMEGIGTELLRRKVARGELAPGSQDRCFSLVTTTRTFDLEALTVAQKKVLVRAFNFLVKHLSRPAGISSAHLGYDTPHSMY